jgi:hypothetical protein
MKNVSYKVIAQSVYRSFTGTNGIVRTELVCLCVDNVEAENIKTALSCHIEFLEAARAVIKESNNTDTETKATEMIRKAALLAIS